MTGRGALMVGRIRHGGSPFTSLGLDWCPYCRMEVDTDTEAEYGENTYVYRRRCNRCGRPIKYGAFHNVPLFSERPMPTAALTWVTQPGQDRSK